MALHGIILQLFLVGLVVLAAAEAQALPGCPNQCGNLSIPFPFGISKGCYLRDEFFIDCNETNQTPTPYLNGTGIPISNLSLNGELQIMQFVARDCYDQDGSLDTKLSNTPRLQLFPPYTISGTKNKFIAVGCDTYAIFEGVRGKEKYITGCMTFCESLGSISESCSGIGCCQTSIPSGLQVRTVTMSSYYNHTFIWDFNPCSYSFIVEEGQSTFSSKSFQELKSITRLPMVLNWAIGDEPCDAAQHRQDYACKGNSTCVNPLNLSGYFCECLPGYEGNPYLPDGCQGTDYDLLYPSNLIIMSLNYVFANGNGSSVLFRYRRVPDFKPLQCRSVCKRTWKLFLCMSKRFQRRWNEGWNRLQQRQPQQSF